MKVLIVLAALAVMQFVQGDDYCFGKDRDRKQTRHFSSKTAYQIVKSTNIDKQYLVPGCEPTKMWIFHRHGTRLPSKKFISSVSRLSELRDEISKNYQDLDHKPITNALCPSDLIGLKMWHWNSSISPDQGNFLTSQGYEDLRGTARLYQRYFPEVMSRDFNSSNYYFRHTDTQRTKESFKAFSEGLFGLNNNAEAAPIPAEDLLLRPYDYCQSWMDHKENAADMQSDKFRQSDLWQNTIHEISSRLGFRYNISDVDVDKMFDICRYEQAWQVDRTSAWCAIFLPEHVQVLEYDEDLKYFYKLGYGYAENSRLNCRAAKDMLTHLKESSGPKVVTYFAHTSGLQSLMTALGINKGDIPLTAENYNQQYQRRWKTSQMDPFAANFVAVKYQCHADPESPEKVVFFLNQAAVNLDWCNVGLCKMSEVMQRFNNIYTADCDSYYCGSALRNLGSSLVLLLSAIIYLIH